MSTLHALSGALRSVTSALGTLRSPLSNSEYKNAFEMFHQDRAQFSYEDFILPELVYIFSSLSSSHRSISVLEIGPGPKSVLGMLPHYLRRIIASYTAFEPNKLFTEELKQWLSPAHRADCPFPGLRCAPNIQNQHFTTTSYCENTTSLKGIEKFDVILFCQSMYGMKPKSLYIEAALNMLTTTGKAIVFYRQDNFNASGLSCQRMVSFLEGVVSVTDDDAVLDSFASFMAGGTPEGNAAQATYTAWRKICRDMGAKRSGRNGKDTSLCFYVPCIGLTFTRQATQVGHLVSQIPVVEKERRIKNRHALQQRPAALLAPQSIQQVQFCVNWARENNLPLSVVGGSHGDHCLRSNVVALHMTAFNEVHIVPYSHGTGSKITSLALVGAGCTTEQIVRKTMAHGCVVPLGSRPSVGAGLWLQGGIGHLTRLYGLTCDAIVGAVLVSVNTGQIIYVGAVPEQHIPAGGVRAENEKQLLWGLAGAGTTLGVVVQVVFRTFPSASFCVRSWTLPMEDRAKAQIMMGDIEQSVAKKLPRSSSIDAYLYWTKSQLHLGVTIYEAFTGEGQPGSLPSATRILGQENEVRIVDGLGLFDTELYMSAMHGGHGGGKTSSFKRCVFLNEISSREVTDILIDALENRPSPLCYFHLLHGSGAAVDVGVQDRAFGCRGWSYACVVTGVWPRGEDNSILSQEVSQWVYCVANKLLPLCNGVYGADLGPDPRDALLAMKAFGPHLPHLGRLKGDMDPDGVLPFTCPIPVASRKQKLIVLVTGKSCAGKDYSAAGWKRILVRRHFVVDVVSISDRAKAEYAEATGANFQRLLRDRAYKEHHRQRLTAFYKRKVEDDPEMPRKHFQYVASRISDLDILFITGMRDDAPVANLWHLIPDVKLVEIRVTATHGTRQSRKCGTAMAFDNALALEATEGGVVEDGQEDRMPSDWRPNYSFDNTEAGVDAINTFAQQHILPLVSDTERLFELVTSTDDFPRSGINFRHVLNIAQEPGGMSMCTSLLAGRFAGDWSQVGHIVCCEAGGLIFASALAAHVDVPLAVVRKGGKLPPPVVSVDKGTSHISSLAATEGGLNERIEIGSGVLDPGKPVVVVDDVLASGTTTCAVLRLLAEIGVKGGCAGVLLVAEFPVHRGRKLLQTQGFGCVNIQSLLVFGGL